MDPNTPLLLHRYILDYFYRSGFHLTADLFEIEAGLSNQPPPLPVFGGLLSDLWDIFYECRISTRWNWNRLDQHTSRFLLNRYIFYYLKRRGFLITAASFPIGTQLPDEPPAIGEILSNWWATNYGIFSTKMLNALICSFLNRNVSSNPQIQSPANPQIQTPANPQIFQTPANRQFQTPANPQIFQTPANQQFQTPANPQIQTPLTVAEQRAEQGDQNDDLDKNVIIISSSSDELQTSSSPEEDSLSSLIPRGKQVTHFLDDFPQESENSKPESRLPKRQKGTSNVPGKVFRGESRQRQTAGQLGLKPNSHKGDEFAKDDMPIEKDDLISYNHPSQVQNIAKGGFSFEEVVTFSTSKDKVMCCHFSSDGKLLATAGNDKMVSVWNVKSHCHVGNTPPQPSMITDVRFKPHSTVFATSSCDTTIRLWDAANVSKLVELKGDVGQVISVDFNPYEPEIVCSCDCNGGICIISLSDINDLACIISEYKVDGGTMNVRFLLKNLLVVASGNVIALIDTELNIMKWLKEHSRDIRSICRDQSGSYLASVSEDSARVWSLKSGWKCDYEVYSTDHNLFQSCTFHPLPSLLLVIGGFQIIEFWDCVEGCKIRSIQLHEGIISTLTCSPEAGLFASASDDGRIRLWR